MEKYQIRKAGIGMKKFSSKLEGRVFESKTFGLSYIVTVKYFKEACLGYPALILSTLGVGILQPFICYVSEDEETWAGEITNESGEKVSSAKTEIYF